MTVPIQAPVAASRITGPELADLLGHWSATDGPLYRLLADRIARLADSGELPSGLLLPPERELAGVLSVSRNTAAAAYQLLRDEGLAHTRQGAGTRVTSHRTTPAAVHRANGFFAAMLEAAAVEVDLTMAAPECAPQVAAALNDPGSVLNAAQRRSVTAARGYHPLGLGLLRATIAAVLAEREGLPTFSEQILVTNGGQQAIDVLIRAMVAPGQSVVVEDPTYPGALDALQRAGGRPVALPADTAWEPGRLAHLIEVHRPALVYLIPTHHNPTGRVMPAQHRLAVADLAARHPGVIFVDDTTLAEVALGPAAGRERPAHLAVPCPRQPNLVTIGSLSKTYWGGLRVGWIRAGADLIRRLAAAKAASDLGSAPHTQAVVAALMADSHSEILRWRSDRLRASRDALEAALRERVPQWSWSSPSGGLTVWAHLPEGADSGAFAQAALRAGVAILPGRLVSPVNRDHRAVRIAYTQPPGTLRAAGPLLAQAWSAHIGS